MHTILQPEGWAKPVGYANGIAARGRFVFVDSGAFAYRQDPMRTYVMSAAALWFYIGGLIVTFGLRTWIHARRTGDTGFRGISGRPGSLVQRKFSIHDACEATGSTACTAAHVRGARHQSWNRHRAPGRACIHSAQTGWTGLLPPCPFTISTRRKPVS